MTTITKHVLLHADGTPEEREGELTTEGAQKALGGSFEQLPSHPDITVFVKETLHDEDGFNWSATRLCQNYLMPTDRVFGPAIVTGPAGPTGETSDVPERTVITLKEWHEHRK